MQSLGRGEGGRSATGAPVLMKVMGTLCAHDSLDCRHTSFVSNGCKTTDTTEPGASDQWERSSFHFTNPGDNTRLAQDQLNQSGKYHHNEAEEYRI